MLINVHALCYGSPILEKDILLCLPLRNTSVLNAISVAQSGSAGTAARGCGAHRDAHTAAARVAALGPRTACRRNAVGWPAHGMWPPLRQRTALRVWAVRHRRRTARGHIQCANRRRNAFRADCSRRGERSRSTPSGPAAAAHATAWRTSCVAGASVYLSFCLVSLAPHPRPRSSLAFSFFFLS